MKLESLGVIHRCKTTASAGLCSDPVFSGKTPWIIQTCQRTLWVFDRNTTPGNLRDSKLEFFAGSDAYRFLLKVCTGLESAVVGETDIFGQIKVSWHEYQSQNTTPLALHKWIPLLFEDTKSIRTAYLQNLGGNSYGSLVRRLIQSCDSEISGPILVLGAGQLASSIAPLLAKTAHHSFMVCNRNLQSAELLVDHLRTQNHSKTAVALPISQEEWAWNQAHHVVICTPPHAEVDLARTQKFFPQLKSVTHLGYQQKSLSPWSNYEQTFFCLEDLFSLEKTCSSTRKHQVELAIKSCNEKAMLRALSSKAGGPVTLPHGWEDLALFG